MVENYKLGYAKCMVTGVYGKGRLTAVHIWPKGQTEISPLPENFEDNYRNGLILMRPIEHAFDRKQLCFLYNFFDVCTSLYIFLDNFTILFSMASISSY